MTTDLYANGVCPYGEGEASGSGCIKPAGHDGAHLVTPGVPFDDDSCGDENDGEVCDRDPGHDGHHCANATVGWAR